MPGSYDQDDRERIRQEMDDAALWIDEAPGDPPANHPDAVYPATGVIYLLAPGPIVDVDFPLAAESLIIGRPHDRAARRLADRRLAECAFVFAARTGAPTPEGVALAVLLEMARMNLDTPLRTLWREVKELELFAMQIRNVRMAMRTRHPGIRGGLEELRRAPSGDPEFDAIDPGTDEPVAIDTKTGSKEAISSAWTVARDAVAEHHAAITYLATPFVSPGGGYLFAVHPLATLSSWGLAGFNHEGTAREAGVRFFSRKMLVQRDPDRDGALVLPRQLFPLLVHFARRKVYGVASLCKRIAKTVRCTFRQTVGTGRLRQIAAYLGAWAGLIVTGRIVIDEMRRFLLAVAALLTVITLLILTRL